MPAPFSTPHSVPVPLPALYLYPLNDSFVPKHISLVNNQRVKIGRQTNVKTVPGERNGFFDSKVLSRQHAEVWEESGKVCCLIHPIQPYLLKSFGTDLHQGRQEFKWNIH